MYRYLQWAQKEHPFTKRIAATLLAGLLVAVLFPLLMIHVGPHLDQQFGLPSFKIGVT